MGSDSKPTRLKGGGSTAQSYGDMSSGLETGSSSDAMRLKD